MLNFENEATVSRALVSGPNAIPSTVLPDLSNASPPVSVLFANNLVYNSFWTDNAADPVSAVLMHDHIMNEFVLDEATNSGTDWVVTMPTKRFYVSNGTGTPARLFQRNFNKTDGACDDVELNIYDREERTTSTPLDFSPPPPTQSNALCWEANVITFNNSNVLGSANVANIPTDFENGWLDIGFFPESVAAPIHTLPNADTTRSGSSAVRRGKGAPGSRTTASTASTRASARTVCRSSHETTSIPGSSG